MEARLHAIEVTGTVDDHQRLHLDTPLPVHGPTRVRVIILFPEDTTWNETEWLQVAAANPAFADLASAEEDIYSLNDGKPFRDQV
jgi:hypothetical protein